MNPKPSSFFPVRSRPKGPSTHEMFVVHAARNKRRMRGPRGLLWPSLVRAHNNTYKHNSDTHMILPRSNEMKKEPCSPKNFRIFQVQIKLSLQFSHSCCAMHAACDDVKFRKFFSPSTAKKVNEKYERRFLPIPL